MNFNSVVSAINTILETVAAQTVSYGNTGVTRFAQVVQGEPMQLPQNDRLVAFWYAGEEEEAETLGNVMTWHRFQVGLYWHPRVMLSDVENLEAERMDSLRAVKTALRADSDLGAVVADLKLTTAQHGVTQFGEQDRFIRYSTLTFELHVWDSEGEAIAK